MRIITVDLINQMNQSESQEDNFDGVWEATLDKLENNNKQILDICPSSVSNFIKEKVLLNCPTLSRSADFYTDEYAFVIGRWDEKDIVFIGYKLNNEVAISSHTGAGFDPDAPAVWLYDEFHQVDGHFEHHVIFSDGISYVIPFEKFYCRTTKWFEEA